MIDAVDETGGQTVLRFMVDILGGITADRDVGELTAGTRLGDLGCDSINLVYLIAEAQQEFGLGDLLRRKLRALGRPILDLTLGEIVACAVEAQREIKA